jgi:hypothetical protein
MGAHVTIRDLRHEKFVIIDDGIAYDGALNVFSQNKTHEHMRRFADHEVVRELIVDYKLNECETCMNDRNGIVVMPNALNGIEQAKLIGNMIARYRKSKHISQEKLAHLTGLHQSQISSLEAGISTICPSRLATVGAALDLELRPVPWHMVPAVDQLLRRSLC